MEMVVMLEMGGDGGGGGAGMRLGWRWGLR
jgi:hypothetical protein